MRSLAVLAACSAVFTFNLALAAPAAAKELTKVTVCGASGCTTITDRDELRRLPTGGDTTAPPPEPTDYYTVTYSVEHEGASNRFTMYYVPAANLLGASPEFRAR